jgi:hypothetical protein
MRLNAFINHFVDFLDDLRLTFPDILDIQTAYNHLYTWSDNGVIKLQTTTSFMKCCEPFFEHIFREDEAFFTDIDNIEKVKNNDTFHELCNQDTQDENIMKMLQLKDVWGELSNTTKKRIFCHMKALLVKGGGALSPTYDHILIFAKRNPELYK